MDEASWTNNCSTTSVTDSSVNSNSGTACPNGTGPTGGATGKINNAGLFDGSNDYVQLENSAALETTTGSISLWAKTSGAGSSFRDMVTKQYTYVINMQDNIVGTYEWNGQGFITTSTNISDGNWHHVVFTFQNGVTNGSKIYIDNVVKATFTYSKLTANNNRPTFGNAGDPATAGSNTENWNGTMDEVAIWSKALSATEVSNLYRSGSGAQYPFYTNTRDTSTTYSSSSGSSKIVAGDVTTFTQSINVGNTNTYNLSAYAYTDGSAVTSSDVQLFYNGSTVSTTYTSVGSGWYQLTGTVTGANASRVYGVQVAANKTVYVDNMSLNSYASSGTLKQDECLDIFKEIK